MKELLLPISMIDIENIVKDFEIYEDLIELIDFHPIFPVKNDSFLITGLLHSV